MQAALLDSSVAVAWVLPDEPFHNAASRILEPIAAGEIEPVVASHFGFEVRSALCRAALRGRFTWPEVRAALLAIEMLEPTIVEPATDLAALELVERHRLQWADAHWVEAARRLDLPLVTADRRLARAVPDEVAIVVAIDDEGLHEGRAVDAPGGNPDNLTRD